MTKKLLKVDLCCGTNKAPDCIGVDFVDLPGVDIVHDLTKGFPFEESSVDYLRAHDAIEHLPDKIATMNEIYRVCKHGATVDIKVPSTEGRGAFQDPTHVSYWNLNSFMYYCSHYKGAYELCRQYGFKGDFAIEQLYNVGTSDCIIWVIAQLRVRKK